MGKVEYLEEDISNEAPQMIVQKGIVQVPEGRKIFAK
jgi:ABC-type branched-subunit amino acid transport system ATPase component